MKHTAPLVSIGLPVYNGQNYLGATLDSLCAQTYRNIEIIISDNASTDATGAICLQYAAKDPRIRYFRNQKNLGAARNYNLTMEYARGVYFKWSAHDDLCKETFIESCVEVLEREPTVVLAYPKTIIIGPKGEIIDDAFEDYYNIRDAEPHRRYKRFTRTPLDCNAVFGVMRLKTLRRTPGIGPYESSDRVLLGELALRGEIAEVPERLLLRRFHPTVSTFACRSKREIARWFDPAASGRFTRLRRFVEYIRSLRRVPLSFSQRSSCVFFLLLFYARMYLDPARWARVLSTMSAHSRAGLQYQSFLPSMSQPKTGHLS